ncbi:hypothetical protein ACPCIU_01320 [Streptomyces seoulensis]|uniref:hypothetical protein n=1 Tax=Streptomyces seoulensis TaxID=73044 RepID=UPI003C2DFAD3
MTAVSSADVATAVSSGSAVSMSSKSLVPGGKGAPDRRTTKVVTSWSHRSRPTWAGMTTPRDAQYEKLGRLPGAVAKAIWALPETRRPAGVPTTWVMAFDEAGTMVADLQTPDAPVTTVTGAVERRGELFCVSTGGTSVLRVAAR